MRNKTHYTITEAARHLGVTRQAILRLIKLKKVKPKQKTVTQKVWVIPAREIENYRVSRSHQERGQKND